MRRSPLRGETDGGSDGAGRAKMGIGAHGGAGGADVPENGADAPEGRFRAVCAMILGGMGADGLRVRRVRRRSPSSGGNTQRR